MESGEENADIALSPVRLRAPRRDRATSRTSTAPSITSGAQGPALRDAAKSGARKRRNVPAAAHARVADAARYPRLLAQRRGDDDQCRVGRRVWRRWTAAPVQRQ